MDGTDSDAVLRKTTWGLDVAGQNGQLNSLESAGGIGGLVAVYDTNGTTTGQNPTEDDKTYVYLYDANGNVGQLVDWTDIPDWESKQLTSAQAWHADRLVARYEYDPYGNVVGPDTDSDGDWTDDAGPYATVNTFRFSTKQWDDETALGYWVFRYYSPTLGRWISRDPIEESGGVGVYSYVANVPVSQIDSYGLSPDPTLPEPLAQKTCGERWEPVPGDDGIVGVDTITYETWWQKVGENSMWDQIFRFRHLIKYARTVRYWALVLELTEVTDCGKKLSFSTGLSFSESETWQVGGQAAVTVYKVLQIGVQGAIGGSTTETPSIGIHFNEGEDCYQYKGYVFAEKIAVVSGFVSPWESAQWRIMQYRDRKEIGFTQKYKKLLCRKRCCETSLLGN